ncbi:MAG TPA: nuclear transport factor 2 family protein [Pyrinomonadaceae bacterium]|nr:nuclear transport factor 2 family protein [Pyrinomonadaceae bacterium]
MKRCSTCNRTYTDPNLKFCIDDGTPLTTVETDDDTTVVRPRDNEDDDWNAAAYRPPTSSYVPPGAEPVKKPRRVWPWIVGIGGAFLLGLVAISIAAAILVPRMMRARQNERARVNVNPPRNSNSAPNRNANTAESSNANNNSTENVATPPPADPEQVLAQLTALENEWTVANLNADKKKLDRILADDYVGQAGEDGGLQSKAEYIETIERDTQIEKWEFSDLKLTLAGDRATLSGIITYFSRDRSVSFDFTDKFVWRDGRWQATGAELKQRGTPGTSL